MSIYHRYPCVKYTYYDDSLELIVVVYDNTPEEDKIQIKKENKEVSRVLTVREDYEERV